MSLCQYKDIFGKSGEGVHSYRVANVAIVDVLLTILVAYAIANYRNYSFARTLFVLIIIGIIAHKLFCVDTTVNNILFPSD